MEKECFFRAALNAVCLPAAVESLGRRCFFCSVIGFEAGSRLRTIGESCFELCTLRAVRIPGRVETIGELTFNRLHLMDLSFELPSKITVLEEPCFAHGTLQIITIPPSVEVLHDHCFGSGAACQPRSLIFGGDSKLRRIESLSLSFCNLSSFRIPRFVEFIDGSAFSGNPAIQRIEVDPANQRFAVEGSLLLDKIDSVLVHYFGQSNTAICHTSCTYPHSHSNADAQLATGKCQLGTMECTLWDMNFVLGKIGGKNRVCYSAVAWEDC
jgi:hypothetical protein